MERYDEGTFPHPLLGLKTDLSGIELNLNSEIADLKKLFESQAQLIEVLTEDLRKLREEDKHEIQKLKDENFKILDKFDTQKMITKELLIRLTAIEDGEVDTVPLSSTNIGNLIEYEGYDKTVTKALMYLEKKRTLYVKDLKRLGITFRFDPQYIRFLHKLGQISGNPTKQAKSGFWYVEKKKDDDDN